MEAIFEKKRHTRAKIAMIVVLALVGLFALYYAISAIGSYIANSPRMIDLYYKKAIQFSEEEKTAIKKNRAGFWEYRFDSVIAGSPLKKTDYLEVKDNGIIWQVVEWAIPMPSGVITTFHHIRTAYVNPFGVIGNDTLNDACIIIQAFIAGSDTCFGAWYEPQMWNVSKEGEVLSLCGRKYRPYSGDIAVFFPSGMIGFVQRAENQFIKDSAGSTRLNPSLYSVRKVDPKTGSMKLFPIQESIVNLSDRFKKELFDTYGPRAGKSPGPAAITDLISSYYQPFLIQEQWRAFPRPLPSEIAATFTVTRDGTVEKIQLPPLKTTGKLVHHGMLREIMSWRFPPPDTPVRVTYRFVMP